MKLRKINRSLHRDIGYFFCVVAIIYGLSGIALNHKNDWNPNYIIKTETLVLDKLATKDHIDREYAKYLLDSLQIKKRYKTHLLSDNSFRIFIDGGSINIDMIAQTGIMETVSKRPLFYHVNFLHYNTAGKVWKWFANLFAAALIFLSISGLFILKGKNGLKWRGAIIATLGVVVTLLFLLIYS